MQLNLTVECPVYDSFRVRQVAGLFDVPVEQRACEQFSAEVPGLDEAWDIGVIVGPSGAGKSTIARAAFGESLYQPAAWPTDCAVIDCFGTLPIKLITRVLTAVGLSSAPAWLKPHAVLSNGEKFRCELARRFCSAARWWCSTSSAALWIGRLRRSLLPRRQKRFAFGRRSVSPGGSSR